MKYYKKIFHLKNVSWTFKSSFVLMRAIGKIIEKMCRTIICRHDFDLHGSMLC